MPPRFDDRGAIKDDEDLWRRVLPLQECFHPIEGGQWRPSSAVFLDRRTAEVSVHVSSLTTVEVVLGAYPHNSLVAIKASVPRGLGHVVCPDPIKDDPTFPDDISHALICPPPGVGANKLKGNARRMALAATWVVLRNPPY
jgi:hypothetical protein